MEKNMVLIERVTKKYGQKTALDNISLSVKEGEIVGILGPNGAGKTTLVSIICALRAPTEGIVLVGGFDSLKEKGKIKSMSGIVFQENSLDKKLTVKENLKLHAALFGFRLNGLDNLAEEAIRGVGLSELQNRIVGTLSGGERQLVEIAKCLLHKPKLFVFDEPTLGLDPKIRRSIWEKIQSIGKNRKNTMMITTHYLEEIENLCDRVVIINKGRIILDDKLESIHERSKTKLIIGFKSPIAIQKLETIGYRVEEYNGKYQFDLNNNENINKLVGDLSKKGFEIVSIDAKKESLESIYLTITGGQP